MILHDPVVGMFYRAQAGAPRPQSADDRWPDEWVHAGYLTGSGVVVPIFPAYYRLDLVSDWGSDIIDGTIDGDCLIREINPALGDTVSIRYYSELEWR